MLQNVSKPSACQSLNAFMRCLDRKYNTAVPQLRFAATPKTKVVFASHNLKGLLCVFNFQRNVLTLPYKLHVYNFDEGKNLNHTRLLRFKMSKNP